MFATVIMAWTGNSCEGLLLMLIENYFQNTEKDLNNLILNFLKSV